VSRSDSLALLFQEALIVVARIRAGRQRLGNPRLFRTQMRNSLGAAEKAASRYGYPASDLETVLKAMAAFLDESLLNAHSPQYAGLYQELFGATSAGESFVRNLAGLFERPDSLTVADVLEVHQLCLLLGFQTHLSGLEIRYLLREIGERIHRIRNARPTPQPLLMNERPGQSESQTVTLSRLIELIEAALGKKAIIDRQPSQPGDVPLTFADISKARAKLGYNPRIKIEQGIPLFVDWFRRNAAAA